MSYTAKGSVVAIAGGVGGARLVDGLDRVLPPDALRVIANTGDDFDHWGLRICPDLDTLMYTLAGLSPEERGWGIEGDTFETLDELTRRGADGWFRLGDRDLATHIYRTATMAQGASLTEVTEQLCRALGVRRSILPMSDQPRPTTIVTAEGDTLAFQEWLVKERAAPGVARVECGGRGETTPAVQRALSDAELIVICPSNPYVSVDPVLSLDGVRDVIRAKTTVAVSPIIGGEAVKGPLARMIPELDGAPPSAAAVASHYEDLLDGYAIDPRDRFESRLPLLETNILIQTPQDRVVLADELLELARSLQ